MLLLAARFDAPLAPGAAGPAADLFDRAVAPLRDEIPSTPSTVHPVYRSGGLCVGWLDRGRFQSGKPAVHVDARPDGTPRLIVLLDGYLTGGLPDAGPRSEHAQAVARLYSQHGATGLADLDGSFVAVLVDFGAAPPATAADVRIVVHTDPAGARPIYAASQPGPGGQLLVGPEPKCFWKAGPLRGDLVPAAILSQIFNSYLFDEMTYWSNVRLLGPARQMQAHAGRVEVQRYWAPVFDHAAVRPPTLEDYRDVLTASIASHLRHFERPVIGLSGGVDSRVLLAGARQAGLPTGLVTWTYETTEQPDGDFATASALAGKIGIGECTAAGDGAAGLSTHLRWHLDNAKLAEQAERIVYINDGLIGYLGAYGDREPLAAELGRHFDAILIGDQCYRGEDVVRTNDEALDAIGVYPLRRTLLADFLLHRDFARTAIADYHQRRDALLHSGYSTDQPPHPQDLHDRLYWQCRVPRILTGPKALYRLYLDAASPMLSRPMIELSTRLTIPQRVDKHLLREATATFAPDLMAVPYARTHSRVKWREVFKRTGPLQARLVELLLDKASPVWTYLDRGAVECLAARCLAQAAQRPREEQAGLLTGLKAWLLRPVARPPMFLNLITLNLWCRMFGSA